MACHCGRVPRTVQRLHEGPLGPYIDAFAAEMRAEGYASTLTKSQIRLVADFSRWLATLGAVSSRENRRLLG